MSPFDADYYITHVNAALDKRVQSAAQRQMTQSMRVKMGQSTTTAQLLQAER